jgi:hypothetical protein
LAACPGRLDKGIDKGGHGEEEAEQNEYGPDVEDRRGFVTL